MFPTFAYNTDATGHDIINYLALLASPWIGEKAVVCVSVSVSEVPLKEEAPLKEAAFRRMGWIGYITISNHKRKK